MWRTYQSVPVGGAATLRRLKCVTWRHFYRLCADVTSRPRRFLSCDWLNPGFARGCVNLALFVRIQTGAFLKAQSRLRNMKVEILFRPCWIYTWRLSAFVRVSAADICETSGPELLATNIRLLACCFPAKKQQIPVCRTMSFWSLLPSQTHEGVNRKGQEDSLK